jgi:bacterioferritin
MDEENFVEALTEDLRTEYQSIVHYISHIATVTGAEFLSTIDELKVRVTQELQHAQILVEPIAFLGGTPATTLPQVNAATGRDALAADLRLEEVSLSDTGKTIGRSHGPGTGRRGRGPASSP